MALMTTCPSCGLQGRFPEEWQGRAVECPRCHTAVSLGPPGPFIESPPAAPAETAPDRTFVMSSPVGTPDRVDAIVPLDSTSVQIAGEPEDDPAVRKWVGEETLRFQAYVTKQLNAIRQQRHELAAIQSQQEVKLVGREHDLNRLLAELDATAEDLRQREEALAKQDEELRRVNEELAAREQGLKELHAKRAAAEREIADLERQRGALQSEVERVRAAIASAHQELQPLEDRRRELQAEQAVWDTRVAEWDRRQENLEREEQALQHRLAEVHELEEQIERELQDRTRDLDRWQRLLEERERNVPNTPAPVPARPAATQSPPDTNRSVHGQP
jgi:translation initiation factor IF-2